MIFTLITSPSENPSESPLKNPKKPKKAQKAQKNNNTGFPVFLIKKRTEPKPVGLNRFRFGSGLNF
jgi:hypothetical protein